MFWVVLASKARRLCVLGLCLGIQGTETVLVMSWPLTHRDCFFALLCFLRLCHSIQGIEIVCFGGYILASKT